MTKTPDEIKTGVEFCTTKVVSGNLKTCDLDCPYRVEGVWCRNALAHDTLEYIERLEAKVPRWISVEERLPKHGKIVFCYTKYFYEILQWDDDAEQWVGQCSIHAKHHVTHWMPLPEPPVEV